MGSYDHRDVAAFKSGLLRLPVTFRFGNPGKGPMARPFAEALSDLAPVEPGQRRNMKTVNRDLSTMSTVAKHLEQTAWKPKVSGARVMDFSGSTVAIQGNANVRHYSKRKQNEGEDVVLAERLAFFKSMCRS